MTHTPFSLFIRDERGLSAIEFALIAPFLMLVFLGSIELSMMTTMDRKVSAAAATLGDLTSRDDEIDNCELNEMFAATSLIFQPRSTANAQLRLTSIFNDAGTLEVMWSEARGPDDVSGDPVISPMTDSELPGLGLSPDLIPEDQAAIYTEVLWPHEHMFGGFGRVDFNGNLTDDFLIRPRRATEVTRDTTTTC